MSEIEFSDLRPSNKSEEVDSDSVRWVKSNIKAFAEPGKPIETNGFGECRFVGATRKAKAKVNTHFTINQRPPV